MTPRIHRANASRDALTEMMSEGLAITLVGQGAIPGERVIFSDGNRTAVGTISTATKFPEGRPDLTRCTVEEIVSVY
jgi:predicted ThiF/HesA family dinucleotide-utilizing enzyme